MSEPASSPGVDQQARTWALLAHLSTFAGYMVPFGNVLGPLIVWLVKKDESAFVGRHAREALNWQISVTIYMVVSAILAFVLIGIGLALALLVVDLVVTIQAAMRGYQGQEYRYPMSLRFV